MPRQVILLLIAHLCCAPVLAKDFTIDWGSGPRYLQSGQVSAPQCGFDNNKLVCSQSTEFTFNGKPTTIAFDVACDADSNIRFDYRRARNCGCMATITNDEGYSKQCPCTVCAAGFGDNPVNVDCSSVPDSSAAGTSNSTAGSSNSTAGSAVLSNDLNRFRYLQEETNFANNPYVMGNCVSFDCYGSCNGTCGISCENSDNQCEFCTPEKVDPTRAPDDSPEEEMPGNFSSATILFAMAWAALVPAMFLGWM